MKDCIDVWSLTLLEKRYRNVLITLLVSTSCHANNSAVVHTDLIQRRLVKQHNCNIATYSPFMQVKLQSHVIFFNELDTVSQWYLLGIYLGLRPSTLDPINADYKTTRDCRTQMLIEWQRRMIPTWCAVVKALVGIGRERLAF